MEVKYWILKSEPSTYSIDDLEKERVTRWDGVRNYQARNNLRQMKKGDVAIIYHSGGDRSIVGIAEVSKPAYQDPTTDEDWSVVDIKFKEKFSEVIPLSDLKADSVLKEMPLVKQSRLSVCPLTKDQFHRLLECRNQ